MESTKGEWKAQGKKVILHHPEWSDDKKEIANCNQWLDNESEANARLIAQAPRLYEACKEAIEELKINQGEWASVTETYSPEWTHPLKRIIHQLEQAIAGVEGK